MFSNQSAEHALNLPCRRISALADSSSHCFLVGSCFLPTASTQESNEVQLIRFHEDVNELSTDAIFTHPTGEVWVMSPSPRDATLLLTCGGDTAANQTKHETVLWRMPEVEDSNRRFQDDYDEDDMVNLTAPLEEVARLFPAAEEASGGFAPDRIASALWSPLDDGELVTLGPKLMKHWDIMGSDASEKGCVSVSSEGMSVSSGSWDPHNPSLVAAACGRDVTIWDLRNMEQCYCIKGSHRFGVRDVDYNPNRPHVMCTGGEDGLVKFWDSRKSARPLKILNGHSHWVSSVKYNPFHDQLVLSGGTDSVVNLWRVSSISSAPLLELEDDGNNSDAADLRVSKLEDPESVYDVAWSGCDAWVFVSLSYDGQVVLNHVPSKEKYKILL